MTRILMLDLQWHRERERDRGNYLIEENFDREEFSWDFVAVSLWNFFLNKNFYPQRRTLPAEKFAKQTLFLTICKKPLRMTFHYVKVAMINEYENDYLRLFQRQFVWKCFYNTIRIILLHRMRFNQSWKWQKILLGKILSGKSVEMFYEISSFLPVEKFFQTKFLPIRYAKIARTIKYYE